MYETKEKLKMFTEQEAGNANVRFSTAWSFVKKSKLE